VLGLCFFIGQWMAWTQLHERGFFIDTNPSSSFAFLLTIGHAVHLAGGMIALLWATIAALLRRPIESRRIALDVTAWYWHFMAVLWIYIFLLLRFVR
jgi:cytochrome c oxidase subunit III